MKIMIVESDFKTRKDFFDYLVKHKDEMIEMKQASRKIADGIVLPPQFMPKSLKTVKSDYVHENDEKNGSAMRTIVANTYLWLDSHDDVHLENLFSKSVAERGNKIPHLRDHIFEMTAKVGQTQSLEEKEINWVDLGVDKVGSTIALIAVSKILKRYNETVYDAYLNDEVDQHSVAMSYIRLALAINDEEYKEEFKVWQSVIERLGNREKAEKQGYFWAVSEAKLHEYSAVLAGSNELTPTLGHKFQPVKSTEPKMEPPVGTPLNIKEMLNFYKELK